MLLPTFATKSAANPCRDFAGSGSLLVVFEKEVDYIVKCLQKMVRENIITMAAKQEAVNGSSRICRALALPARKLTHLLCADWQEYVHTYFQKTVFSTKCALAIHPLLPSPPSFPPFFPHRFAFHPFLCLFRVGNTVLMSICAYRPVVVQAGLGGCVFLLSNLPRVVLTLWRPFRVRSNN